LLALLPCLLSAGCALTDETIHLPSPEEVAVASQRGGGRPLAITMRFADGRRDAQRCGMKKNGYNVDTASVLCAEDPSTLVPLVLARELRSAGFRVVVDRRPNAASLPADTIPVLSGTIEQLFIEFKSNFFGGVMEADVGLFLTVRTPDGRMARRRFFVKGQEGSTFATVDDMRAALVSAVHELMLDVVGAVANLMDNVPMQPAPPPPRPAPPPPSPENGEAPAPEAG
jgi:uncharacterized lipoprotein YajG